MEVNIINKKLSLAPDKLNLMELSTNVLPFGISQQAPKTAQTVHWSNTWVVRASERGRVITCQRRNVDDLASVPAIIWAHVSDGSVVASC